MRLLDAQLAAGVKVNAAEFAREHGVSVRTVYRHRARARAEGQWRPRSRQPHTSPHATPADLQAWILKLRDDLGVDNGADHIRDALIEIHTRTSPRWAVPARSTINRVLSRHDKLQRNPDQRPRSSWQRFSYDRPRDCYQQDATTYTLADGSTAAIVEVLDDCTHYLVACRAHRTENAQTAIDTIEHAVTHAGAPGLVLTDNGAAFTIRHTHPDNAISAFTRTVLGFGSRLIHSSPYHPQTCGKIERHHQTLKKWLRRQHATATIDQLQQQLDTYREHYNHRRHSALPRRMTPAQAWAAADNLGGPSTAPRQVDATVHHCRVATNGAIRAGTHRMSVGSARAGSTVTVIRHGDHATVYDPDGHPLGQAYLDPGKDYVPFTPAEPTPHSAYRKTQVQRERP